MGPPKNYHEVAVEAREIPYGPGHPEAPRSQSSGQTEQ